MEELINNLDIAFKAISKIPVSGDNVDAMALARMKLREVYAKLRDMESAAVKAEAEV